MPEKSKDILVFAGEAKATKRLIYKARQLAGDIGCFVYVISTIEEKYDNADVVIVASSLEEKKKVLSSKPISVTLFDISLGEIATTLAHSYETELVSPVFDFYYDSSVEKFIYKVKAYEGRLVKEFVLTKSPEFVVVDTTAFSDPPDADSWAGLMGFGA